MRLQLKKIFLITQIFIFLACNSKIDQKITISKIEGSPSFESSKLSLTEQVKVELHLLQNLQTPKSRGSCKILGRN